MSYLPSCGSNIPEPKAFVISNFVLPICNNFSKIILIIAFWHAFFNSLFISIFTGILVSIIQAYVFTVLSMVYISLAVSHHDHDEHAAH